jgi:hypothetical protein
MSAPLTPDERPRCEHHVVYPMENCAPCLRAALAVAQAQAARYREALAKYAKHHRDCRLVPDTPHARAMRPKGSPFVPVPCSCGLAAALAAPLDTSALDAEVEHVASVEHEQWMEWASSLMLTEKLSPERVARWTALMVPYSELSEDAKERDRVWARKAIRARGARP